MNVKINKCIKVTLNKCLNMDIKEMKQIIREANYKSCLAANKAMRLWLFFKEQDNDRCEFELLGNKKEYESEIDELFEKQKNKKNAKPRNYFRTKVYSNAKKMIMERYEEEFKVKYGKTLPNHIEGFMKDIMHDYNTGNVGALHQQLVQGAWNRNEKDILEYKANISTFKEDTPYFIRNGNYTLTNYSVTRMLERIKKAKESGIKNYKDGYNNEGYFVSLSFFGDSGLSKYGYKRGHKFEFEIDKLDGNKKAVINNIINGNYKGGSVQISITNKEKIELIISYGFEKEIDETKLNPNRVLGIDLGIVNTATMSIWDNDAQEWDMLRYSHRILKGDELIKFRQKLFNMGMTNKEIEDEIQKQNEKYHQSQLNKFDVASISGIELSKMRNGTEKRKIQIGNSSKCVGEGRIGHGRKTRMKPLNDIRNKVSNFADTYNHKYSKYIVDFAVKNNCGVIQMEDLSCATSNTNDKFLKDWAYYDLQQKIIYKAREQGIKVGEYKNKFGKVTESYMVNPRYTSKRCSKCGNIHNDNRDCKNNQARFECIVCGHKENADINAAKNIAIPNIDKIIDTYIKESKKAS